MRSSENCGGCIVRMHRWVMIFLLHIHRVTPTKIYVLRLLKITDGKFRKLRWVYSTVHQWGRFFFHVDIIPSNDRFLFQDDSGLVKKFLMKNFRLGSFLMPKEKVEISEPMKKKLYMISLEEFNVLVHSNLGLEFQAISPTNKFVLRISSPPSKDKIVLCQNVFRFSC